MPRSRRSFLAVLAVAFLAIAFPAVGEAQSLDKLRASGAVGERYDGYAVARDGGAKATVDQVNQKRKQIYQERAAAQGVPADQVGRVYAKEIFRNAPKGTWFLQENGQWVQK